MQLNHPPLRRAGAAMRSATVIGLLLVAVPRVLAMVAGWPLPRQLPDLSNMWLAARQQNIGSEVVINSIAAIAWLLWAQFVWAMLWELAVCLPGASNENRTKRAPLVAPAIGDLATRLVAGALTIGIFAASPVLAAPLPAPMSLRTDIAVPFTARTPVTATTRDRLQAEDATWIVQRGETAWSIAESALGDGSRFGEIMAANPRLTSVRNVAAGMARRLPAGAATQTEYLGDSAGTHSVDDDDDMTVDGDWREILQTEDHSFLAEKAIVIERGDHIWGLSENRLADATGHAPTDMDVLTYVNSVIDMNQDVVEDPNLIYPGEVFTFPQIGVEPAATDAVPAEREPLEAPNAAPIELPSDLVTVPAPAPAINTQRAPATVTNESSLFDAGAPYVAGIAGALVAATGLLAMYRAVQRRRATRGEVASARPTSDLGRSLVAASNMPLIRWAGQELSMLVSRLDESTAGGPLAVEVMSDGIEVLWEIERPEAPHPWEAADGGSAWRLLFDADAPIPNDELPAGIPALLSLGLRKGGGTVLVDLEAYGSLAVSGEPLAVANTVRAFATELGASEDLANVNVMAVGIDLALPAVLERVKFTTTTQAIAEARSVRDQYQALIDQADSGDSFGLRVAAGVGPDALVLVVTNDCPDLAELLTISEPRRGLAVVVAGECDAANASLHINADGSAEILPLGLRIAPASMPASTLEILESALTSKTHADGASLEESESVSDDEVWGLIFGERVEHAEEDGEPAHDSTPAPQAEKLAFDDDLGSVWERPSADIVVTLLGEPRVEGHGDLSARQVSLLGLLACHGGEASAEFLLDHLWADQETARSRKTLWNLQSAVRREVGVDVLPLSPKDQPLTTTAISDVTIFEALATRAAEVSSGEALRLLAEALELIEGAPFNHSQFEWARSIEVYEPVRQMIEAAALRLTELALEAGTVDVARKGLCHGLKALGVNEPLYRARMRVEAHHGDRASVSKVYQELCGRLADLFDGAEPSDETKALMVELTNATAKRAA